MIGGQPVASEVQRGQAERDKLLKLLQGGFSKVADMYQAHNIDQ